MANDDNSVFPRIPEKNWWILRDQFSKSLPKEVSLGYLKSLLQLSSEGAARNLLPPLKQLGLIDDENRPTDLANDWRNDSKYADACTRMLETYPQELRDLYNSPDVDRTAVDNWFQYTGKLGKGTARQAAAMYMLLLEAEPKDSTEFTTPKKKAPSSNSKKETAKTKAPVEPPVQNTVVEPSTIASVPVASDNDVRDWFSLHIDLQIHISPEADAEQIDNIFASMAKHIMSMKRGHNNDEGN